MKSAVVFTRDRPFFGSNITCIPPIYMIHKYLECKEISVFITTGLDCFYKQIPWVSQHYEKQNLLNQIRNTPKNNDLIYSMRPSMDTLPIIKTTTKTKALVGFSLRSSLSNHFFNHHEPCDTSTYRGLAQIMPLHHYLNLPENPTYYLREAMLALIGKRVEKEQRVNIIPGAGGGEHKKWGVDNYLNLILKIRSLNKNIGFNLIIGNQEKKEADYLQQKTNHLNIDIKICENLPLKDLTALIESGLLTVSNDCGPSHIAQCLTAPFIGIYFEENKEWFLKHEHSVALYPDNKDIKAVSVDLVFEKTKEPLGKVETAKEQDTVSCETTAFCHA